jgi:hypothetical protein
MPRDFPDMDSLIRVAECHDFRPPADGESEDAYRSALADHVQPRDYIESLEIRNRVGWNKFTAAQNLDMITRLRR